MLECIDGSLRHLSHFLPLRSHLGYPRPWIGGTLDATICLLDHPTSPKQAIKQGTHLRPSQINPTRLRMPYSAQDKLWIGRNPCKAKETTGADIAKFRYAIAIRQTLIGRRLSFSSATCSYKNAETSSHVLSSIHLKVYVALFSTDRIVVCCIAH